MPQHDYVLDNQTSANFRADLNNALLAIRAMNSGTSAPTATAPGMLWYDTTNSQVKMRNSADSGWNIIGLMNEDYLDLTSRVSFLAYLSADQSISPSSSTDITFDMEVFDTNSNFDTSTYKFTPTKPGTYIIGSKISIDSLADGKQMQIYIYKNGSTLLTLEQTVSASSSSGFFGTAVAIDQANGLKDCYMVSVLQNGTVSRNIQGGARHYSHFFGFRIDRT